jgi:hypothetical protein
MASSLSLHIQRYEYQQFHIAPDHAPGKRLTAAERLQRNRQYTQQFGANNTSTAARETTNANGNGGSATQQGGHRRRSEAREPSAERDNSSVELEYADAQLFHDRKGHSKVGEPEQAEEDFSLSANLAKNVASVSHSVQQLQVLLTMVWCVFFAIRNSIRLLQFQTCNRLCRVRPQTH